MQTLNDFETGSRVLIVDDKESNRELLDELLSQRGYETEEATNGREAVEKTKEMQPDVVLLDIMMPVMNGFEACQAIREAPGTAHIPVLMITALTSSEDKLKAIEVGANDFLSKPINSREVLLRVRNAVHAKRLHDEVQNSYQRLQELEQLRDNLVSMIVHDMRNPLMGISGFLDLLQMVEAKRMTGRGQECVRKALASTQELIEMVSSLLDVSRMEAGKMPLTWNAQDLRPLVDKVFQSFKPLVDDRQFELDLAEEPVTLECDGTIIGRVVTNLVSNALKFTPPGGSVRVGVEKTAQGGRVWVADSGQGIAPEHQSHVFEKFGQVRARQGGIKYSSGIGLTFCRLAVEAHSGHIGLDSEVGKGSVFWFTLPLPE